MAAQALGLDETHLTGVAAVEQGRGEAPLVTLHRDVAGPLADLRCAARREGFEIGIISGWRSFTRQQAIWNQKVEGVRPCLNDAGQCIDLQQLDPLDRIHAILRFSALPGASRHHWGTDLDIFDAAAVPASYVVQLVAEEYRAAGPFAPLKCWLARHALDWGFVFPYDMDRGGIAEEPWHMSHGATAKAYEETLTPDLIAHQLAQTELRLKAEVLAEWPAIFERYVQIA